MSTTPEVLFARNVRLAFQVANRYWGHPGRRALLRERGHDLEDVEQSSMLGLWSAACGFRPALGFAFSTYAWRCCWNRIGDLIEGQRVALVDRLDFPLADGGALDPADLAAGRELAAMIDDALQELPATHRDALYRRMNGATLGAIGAAAGVSHQTARTWVENTREALAERLGLTG